MQVLMEYIVLEKTMLPLMREGYFFQPKQELDIHFTSRLKFIQNLLLQVQSNLAKLHNIMFSPLHHSKQLLKQKDFQKAYSSAVRVSACN